MTDDDRPLVSIGVPVYNGAEYLERALDSLLAQTYEHLEVVLCDNGSTDATPDICRTYVARDERIRFFAAPENRGAAWSHNEVFRRSTGTFFRWAAHDDLSAPTYVERCLEALEHAPDAVLARPQALSIDEHDAVVDAYPDVLDVRSHDVVQRFREVLFPNYPCFEVYGLIRSSVLARTGLIGAYYSSDRVLICELALHGPFARVHEALFLNRQHAGRSVRRYPGQLERSAWFDPSIAGRRFVFPGWRYAGANFDAIRRAPVDWRTRRRCALLVLRFLAAHPRLLAGDLRRVVRPRRRVAEHAPS